jgi:hypothetical protein
MHALTMVGYQGSTMLMSIYGRVAGIPINPLYQVHAVNAAYLRKCNLTKSTICKKNEIVRLNEEDG